MLRVNDSELEKRMEALGLRDLDAKERLVREAVRRAVARLEQRMQAQGRLEAFFQEAINEGSTELTAAVWEEVLASKPEDLDFSSLAVPPRVPALR